MTKYTKKTFRRNKTIRRNKTVRRNKTIRRNKTVRRNNFLFGGTSSTNVDCCICSKSNKKLDMLTPRKCLNKHGLASHKICQECWWDKKIGFALENGNHACPGCKKKLSLTHVPKIKGIIDLTEDDM